MQVITNCDKAAVTEIAISYEDVANRLMQEYRCGDAISMDRLYTELGISLPEYGTRKEIQAAQFAVLAGIDGLRNALLVNHKVWMSNVRGYGYRLLTADEQVSDAMHQLASEMNRSMNKADSKLKNLRTGDLSTQGRSLRADAINKLNTLQHMARPVLG